jgi:pimeloyl-ACP methyl ester carboxylesterase
MVGETGPSRDEAGSGIEPPIAPRVRRAFGLLERVNPAVGSRWAIELWCTPPAVEMSLRMPPGVGAGEPVEAMGKAITSSPDLRKKVAAQRVEMFTGVLADRFGAPATDRRVQSGLKLWSAVLAATYLDVLDRHGRFDPLVDEESPEYMRNRLNRAFRIVTGRGTRA